MAQTPPATWQEHWFEHNQLLSRVFFDNDVAIVDRALDAHMNDVIMWWKDEVFMISTLATLPAGASVWGVVTTVIHQYRGEG